MKRVGIVGAVLVVAGALVLACVGDDPVVGGVDPGTCTAEQKTCNAICVSSADPTTGCGGPSCTPCSTAINATPGCNAGACATTCNPGFSDCDGDPATGCEAKTSADVSNCGACGKTCGSANTTVPAKCEASKCVLACATGFGHCGTDDAAGCETNLQSDKLSCGACGHSCLGGECAAGVCQPFQLASANGPTGLSVDKTNVYWAGQTASLVQRIGRDGTCTPAAPCPQDFAGFSGDSSLRGVNSVLSDGVNVFLGNVGVQRRAATGGALTIIGPGTTMRPGNMVIAGGEIYWTSNFGSTVAAPHVRRAKLDGTGLATVAVYPEPVASFAGTGGIATDGTNIYWGAQHSGIYRAPLGAATCTENSTCTRVVNGAGPAGLVVDDTFVYWTEPANGGVYRAVKAGGPVVPIALEQDVPTSIAVVGTTVYWGNVGTTGPSGGSIRKAAQVAAVCSGAACDQVAKVTTPEHIVVADDALYWTDNSSPGGVYRLAK